MVKVKKKKEDPGRADPTFGRGQLKRDPVTGKETRMNPKDIERFGKEFPRRKGEGGLPFSIAEGGKQRFFKNKEEFEAAKSEFFKKQQQEDIKRQDAIRAGTQGIEEPGEIVRDAFVDELGFPRPGILETQDEAQERAKRKAGNILTVGALGASAAASLTRVTAVSNEVALIQNKFPAIGLQTNTKNFATSKSFMQKVFSARTMGILGGAAATTFLGMWGQAEAAEPLSIIMRDILREAERTGDFSIYDEAKEARDEILDLEKWEQIALRTPIAPVVGITNKIKGAIKAAKIMDKQADTLRLKTLEGGR